jgi:ubiquinone biosynthesis protein
VNALSFTRLVWQLYGPGRVDPLWIQRQGLLAVKLGQMHALRADFLPAEKCLALSTLFRANEALPPAAVRGLLEQALPGAAARFARFDEAPLASASVGQVHAAALMDGREVVVKLVKAAGREAFEADVAGVRRLFRLALALYPPLRRLGDPLGILEDVAAYTLAELDLRHEAAGQARLRAVAAQGHPALARLRFPAIEASCTGPGILVSERVPGPSFDELLAQGALPYEALLEHFRAHSYFVFGQGFFHGDLHPGNVLLSGSDLWWIDTGFIGEVDDRTRLGLFEFFDHLVTYDFGGCAQALNAMSSAPLEGAAFEAFRAALLKVYEGFEDRTVAEVSLSRKMMETIRLAVLSGMRFPRSIFPIIRAFMYMDGMVLRCRPQARLMQDLRPFLKEGRGFLKPAAA